METRYSNTSLRGILIDIHMLAHSDYLVCTFSSNVCRLAYEIMQTLHPDASARIKSLDLIYFHEGLGQHHQELAIYAHKASRPGEISMKEGDVLSIPISLWNFGNNNWDGYSMVS